MADITPIPPGKPNPVPNPIPPPTPVPADDPEKKELAQENIELLQDSEQASKHSQVWHWTAIALAKMHDPEGWEALMESVKKDVKGVLKL